MFKITQWEIDDRENSVQFSFECSDYGEFCETITFPEQVDISQYVNDTTFHRLLDIAHAYLGVSYYKLAATNHIEFGAYYSDIARQSIEKLYTEGLGEFYIRNALEYPPNIAFTYPELTAQKSVAVPEEDIKAVNATTATVAFGGGKDSHVSLSLLGTLDIKQELVSVVLANNVQATLNRLSYKDITFIHRQIDPQLISLVKEGKGYNGHIPITAINSIILSIYSYMAGNNWVVFSNERGASVPTMHHGAYAINHQYSKSVDFEYLFRNTLNDICGKTVQYFSMLRPFSELWIASYLGRKAKAAHDCFSSCNRNFVFEGKNKLPDGKRWCGKCSKCVYTAIIIAPHVTKDEFMAIFDGNIFNDGANVKIAKDLCGIGESKPWECVGDFADTASSLCNLASQDEWATDIIPKQLVSALHDKYGAEFLEDRFTSELSSRSTHFLPEQVASLVTPSQVEE